MKHIALTEQPQEKDPAHTIYVRVLLQMLEDVGRGEVRHRSHQMAALNWFKHELLDVEIVCHYCAVKPVWVYREVGRRLMKIGIRCRRITQIRWELRKGRKLREIK